MIYYRLPTIWKRVRAIFARTEHKAWRRPKEGVAGTDAYIKRLNEGWDK